MSYESGPKDSEPITQDSRLRLRRTENRRRVPYRGLEASNLVIAEVSPESDLQPGVPQRPDGDAAQPNDGVADGLAHLAHLAVASLPQRDDECGFTLIATRGNHADSRPRGASPIDGDTSCEALDIMTVGEAGDVSFVDTGDSVARMGQPCGERSVVGEEEQTLCVEVQSAYWIDVLANAWEQIQNSRSMLWIGSRRNVADRLVEEDVTTSLDNLHTAAVDPNIILRRVRLGAELTDRGAVDAHTAIKDELLGRPPGGYPGARDDLL